MGWVQLAASVVALIVKVFDMLVDRNKERKRKKKEALKEVTDGIKKRDISRVTSGFDRANRL